MGFGHRVYKTDDPRSVFLRGVAERIGAEKIEFAKVVEQTVVDVLAELKPGRDLYANVEFYAGVVMDHCGLPRELFTPDVRVVAGSSAGAPTSSSRRPTTASSGRRPATSARRPRSPSREPRPGAPASAAVVVADNDPDALELLVTDLRLEGHDVVGTATGGEQRPRAGRGADARCPGRRPPDAARARGAWTSPRRCGGPTPTWS